MNGKREGEEEVEEGTCDGDDAPSSPSSDSRRLFEPEDGSGLLPGEAAALFSSSGSMIIFFIWKAGIRIELLSMV